MDRAEAAAMTALEAEVAALRRQVEANDRELVRLLVNLAGEVEKNRALFCGPRNEAPAPLVDAPTLDLYRLIVERGVGLACGLLAGFCLML